MCSAGTTAQLKHWRVEMLRNSVLKIDENTILPQGLHRVLDFLDESELCLFQIGEGSKSSKPVCIVIQTITSLMAEGLARVIDETPPLEVNSSEETLTPDSRARRDYLYDLIEGLVSDSGFLRDYCSGRSRRVIEHAEVKGVKPLQIYRVLNRFWKYGQHKNALLPMSSAKGGKGIEKACSSKQRGRPIDQGVFRLRKKTSVNVDPTEKRNIAEAINLQIREYGKFSYARAYCIYKRRFCEEEISAAYEQNRPTQLVSQRQFRYWAQKLMPKEALLKEILTKSKFRSNYHGLTSSVSDRNRVPGFRYELDSTIADVYIVSEYDRERVLGKPTVYTVVDAASRMIAGVHVSMKYASWNLAREAIFNAFTSKVAYCKRYGIDISDPDWPCIGIPTQLICDRGEMIGREPEKLAQHLGSKLEFTPPYRGDAKSIVERRFGIMNEEVHFLPGTTRGELRSRGEKDYRLDAALTINAFTRIILDLFIEHNKERIFDELVTPEMVQHDLSPTPLNYWSYHVARHRHGLRSISESLLIANLMSPGTASVTAQGIVFDGRRYICDKATEEGWSTKARINGSWNLEARSDTSWTTNIYIRDPSGFGYLKCTLNSADRTYRDRHQADIIYIDEWLKEKKDGPGLDYSRLQRTKRTNDLVQSEVKKSKEAQVNLTKNARITGIKKNRQDYISGMRGDEPSENKSGQIMRSEATERNRLRILELLRAASKEEE